MLSDRQFGNVANRVQKPDAGATINVHTGHEPTSGWMVATHGHEEALHHSDVSAGSLRDYTQRHAKALSQTGHLGLWHHPASGQVYHDVSKVFPGNYEGGAAAIAAGYHHSQISVFNRDRFQTVYMQPGDASEKRQTKEAMGHLRRERPQGTISSMPTKTLGSALKNRKPL